MERVDLRGQRHLYNGFGNDASRAFELVLTPLIFAGLGWLLDRLLGTSPLLVVVLGLFGFAGVCVRSYFQYVGAWPSTRPSCRRGGARWPDEHPCGHGPTCPARRAGARSSDMVRRGAMAAPVLLVLGAVIWGLGGAASVGFGIAIVLANLSLSAVMLAWAARRSPALLMGTALGGFLLRMSSSPSPSSPCATRTGSSWCPSA